jgi:hypothetical protein
MPEPTGFFQDWSQKMLSLFTKREVKTPLGFFFRVVWVLPVILVAAFYAVSAERRFEAFLCCIGLLAAVILLVSVFAWFRPKNLVYGETGHRAELKLGMGTERQEISASDLASLPGAPNQIALPRDRTI